MKKVFDCANLISFSTLNNIEGATAESGRVISDSSVIDFEGHRALSRVSAFVCISINTRAQMQATQAERRFSDFSSDKGGNVQ